MPQLPAPYWNLVQCDFCTLQYTPHLLQAAPCHLIHGEWDPPHFSSPQSLTIICNVYYDDHHPYSVYAPLFTSPPISSQSSAYHTTILCSPKPVSGDLQHATFYLYQLPFTRCCFCSLLLHYLRSCPLKQACK